MIREDVKEQKKGREEEILESILDDSKKISYQKEKESLDWILPQSHERAVTLCRFYFEKVERCKKVIALSKEKIQELENVIERFFEPPWYPCTFWRYSELHQKAIINTGERKMAVSVHPDLEREVKVLKTGSELYLNHEMNTIIAVGELYPRSGIIGTFVRFEPLGERAVLKGVNGQELVVHLSDGLTTDSTIKAGDPVIFDPEARVAYEKFEKIGGEEHFLVETPVVSFEQIGGLDPVVEELVDEIEMNLFHRDIVEKYKLPSAKGILLTGPPGCGKTLLAKAMANYIGRLQGKKGCKFMSIKPGSHRSMWYGETERQIRQIFQTARDVSKDDHIPVILFFDELDNVGERSGDAVNANDSKTLTSFLSEIDGMEDGGNIFLIGATNRPELLDIALIRPGRFGDRVYQISRPNRQGAESIFRIYLTPDLPYGLNGGALKGQECVEEILQSALSYLYSPRGEGYLVATLVLRDGKRKPVHAPEVVSGAFIANCVREAKKRSCAREIQGGSAGIGKEDLLEAIDQELDTMAMALKGIRGIHSILTDLSDDIDVIRVEVSLKGQNPSSYQYMRGA